jgi:hypothetical protein
VKITIEHPEVYIFSASKGSLSRLTRTMCEEADEPYDACIHIRDLQHLAHRLFYRGRVRNLQDARMSQLFQDCRCAEVIYDTLVRGQELGHAPEASPFLKDIYFADQHEIRIAFFPYGPIGSPTLDVQFPHPNQLLNEVFRLNSP